MEGHDGAAFFSISEASAKIRTGPPKDDEEDYALDIWAGVLPLQIEKKDLVPRSIAKNLERPFPITFRHISGQELRFIA